MVCVVCSLFVVLLCAPATLAQTSMGAQARVLVAGTALGAGRDTLSLDIALSQPVPYRLRTFAAPPRLVIDFNTVDWAGVDLGAEAPRSHVRATRQGQLSDGWSRLVLDLGAPFQLASSEQRIDPDSGEAVISLRLKRVALEEFERSAQDERRFVRLSGAAFLHPESAPAPARAPRKPVVMLDPGHGGIDPGAERDGIREADIVLSFARQLREVLLRRGHFDVAMTRDADEFVSLDGRIRAARAAQADLFLSLHADALPEGLATGTVIYLLGDEASDESAAYLAERHDRADMLAGVDLTGNTDEIARVLMSVAWQDTAPRARGLADALVEGLGDAGMRLHRRPIQSGAFTVLRAVDMPSALIELGFMSSPRDLQDLRDPDWTLSMAEALADALELWQERDTAIQELRRR
ncbi:N-acetylmuramoyl-L-alanine amidase [Roseinatronobacter sp.]|uniref:N-acetylmuramoyl-L-alanine amidase n=1 Tax=Roseinatronobacter sp. TaxID=1945755 RepID=UPI0025F0DF70|nr:N-acetylmuramoyl-L-alanine amidase [Rhodobaca sp.]